MPLLAAVRDSAGLLDRDGAAVAGHVIELDGSEISGRLGQADVQHIECGSGQIVRLAKPMTVTADARCPYEDGALRGAGRDFQDSAGTVPPRPDAQETRDGAGIPTAEARRPLQPIRSRRRL